MRREQATYNNMYDIQFVETTYYHHIIKERSTENSVENIIFQNYSVFYHSFPSKKDYQNFQNLTRFAKFMNGLSTKKDKTSPAPNEIIATVRKMKK